MFIQTWNKYLPVIRILLKRSVIEGQTLDMNQSDFQRASGGKKVKLTFSFELGKGRLNGMDNPPPLARDLVTVLQQDDIANKFIRRSVLQFSMNSDFQLMIKNTTPQEQVEETNIPAEEINRGDASTAAE